MNIGTLLPIKALEVATYLLASTKRELNIKSYTNESLQRASKVTAQAAATTIARDATVVVVVVVDEPKAATEARRQ